MVDSIYSPTGRQKISSVCLQHTNTWANPLVAQENYAPERSYSASIAATGGNTTVVSAVTGLSVVVDSYVVVASGASSIKFLSGSTDITGAMLVSGSGGISASSESGMIRTSSGEALVLNSTSAVAGHISYRLI